MAKSLCNSDCNGGEGGIRTPDTLSGMPVFKTGAINHSATSPDLLQFYYRMSGRLPQSEAVPVLIQALKLVAVICTAVFKTACFNHSHIPPLQVLYSLPAPSSGGSEAGPSLRPTIMSELPKGTGKGLKVFCSSRDIQNNA